MALKNFAASEAVTSANLNAMVDDLPRAFVHSRTPDASVISTTSTTIVEKGRVRLRPVTGNFVHIRYEVRFVNSLGVGEEVRTKLEAFGLSIANAKTTVGAINVYETVTYSLDMRTTMPAVGDVTCLDLDVILEMKAASIVSFAEVKNVMVICSDGPLLADVGL
jgi:hypothetical protein